MRLIKAFGLAAIAATAAMAFVGASPAMATGSTALCHNDVIECPELSVHVIKNEQGEIIEEIPLGQISLLHMVLTAGHVGKLHGTNPTINILCLEVLAEGHVLELAQPQEIHLLELNFGGCGTNSGHSNCNIEALEIPVLIDVLNEGSGLGSATGQNGVTLVDCEVPFIGHVVCEYTGEGLGFDVKSAGGENGHGMLNSAGTELENIGGPGFLCSDTSEIEEGLLEPLTDVYLSS